MTDTTRPLKKPPVRAPRQFVVRDNVPEGCAIALAPAASRLLVRLFGEEALRRASGDCGNDTADRT